MLLYDLAARKLADLPGVSTARFDERMPALSGDGRYLAYATNDRGGKGLTDVFLFDRKERKVDTLPELNSEHTDFEPALSGDGRLIASDWQAVMTDRLD